MPRETKHRLPREFYIGRVRCTFTICVKNRGKLFTRANVVKVFSDILLNEIKRQNVNNWVYVYMPDHLHLILEGENERADLWKAMVLFKQKTGHWLSKNNYKFGWQKDFYDHLHRKDEDIRKHVMYLLENPVRKGLVGNWHDYKFLGSLDHDLREIIE